MDAKGISLPETEHARATHSDDPSAWFCGGPQAGQGNQQSEQGLPEAGAHHFPQAPPIDQPAERLQNCSTRGHGSSCRQGSCGLLVNATGPAGHVTHTRDLRSRHVRSFHYSLKTLALPVRLSLAISTCAHFDIPLAQSDHLASLCRAAHPLSLCPSACNSITRHATPSVQPCLINASRLLLLLLRT